MKKQLGFTLIELMVVMAIIAILATAGLSAYTGYIKKARDTTRIADLNAINTVVLGMLSATGTTPTSVQAVADAVKETNNGQFLKDPLDDKAACFWHATSTTSNIVNCGYYYVQCDDGNGFAVATMFESKANQAMYGYDATGEVAALGSAGGMSPMPATHGVSTGNTAASADALYMVGSCKTYCTANCTIDLFTYIPTT